MQTRTFFSVKDEDIRESFFTLHTIRKVKLLSKNSISRVIHVIRSPRQRNIVDNNDWIRAFKTFLTFAVASFFGTGNIASLNSFDLRSIQTLLTYQKIPNPQYFHEFFTLDFTTARDGEN